MDDEMIRAALQNVSLFSDVLTSDQLDELARECSPSFFPAGSVVIRQGEAGGCMFCITEGRVALTFVDQRNRAHGIRELGAGSVVGEIELLTGEPRLATVTAVTDLRALEISKGSLERVLARAPDLIEAFGSVLAIRQEMLQQIAGARSAPLKSRIARRIRSVFGLSSDAPEGRGE